ncbi:acyl-CoA dehydrogenase family protein [Nocardioides sp. AN3]
MTIQDQVMADETAIAARILDLKERAKALRAELPESAADVDARNTDTGYGMRRIWEEGLFAWNLPYEYGGINGGDLSKHTEDFFSILLDLVAGDSSAGMNYVVQSLVTFEIFGDNGLPRSTKDEVAKLIAEEGIRFVASNSEAGSPARVIGTKVEGGLRLNGVKTFNTNSGGEGWANVGFILEGEEGMMRHHALVPLSQEAVTCRHDWDVMGQRGTHSQTIEYNNVFVPDGYWWDRHSMSSNLAAYVFHLHSAITLGPGIGALDAAIEYVRKLDRPTLPEFASAIEDPLVRRRVGEFAASIESAKAYLLRAAAKLENSDGDDPETLVEAFAVKVACVRASLEVTSGIFELTGARSTSNKYRFDRFWRNARTFATHDPTDAKSVWVGDYYLTGKEPPFVAMLRV